eukprot:1180527-Ditylum_brightwellii.AAC.1
MIILFSDINKLVRHGQFGKMLEKIGLTEYSSTQHPHLPEPNSWFRGKQQIAGVWCSPDLVAKTACFFPLVLALETTC